MKSILRVFILAIVLALLATAKSKIGVSQSTPADYKVDAMIESVIKIQAMGPELGVAYLAANAHDPDNFEFFAWCRMLFVKSPARDFRPPLLGAPHLLGKSKPEAWPLEPIELVNGIPLLVVKGYTLRGRPELPSSYLKYCIENCKWNDYKFKKVTPGEKAVALDRLISKRKRRCKFSEDDLRFLKEQF